MVEDEFLKIIKELQEKIEYDEEKTYSKIVIREYRNPTNFGIIEHSDADGTVKGPCDDTMKITLKIENGIIIEARFWTDGCGATIAAGNMLTKMVIGKTLQEANNVNSKQLLDALDGLPKEHTHCALLAVNTLHKAVEQYQKRR